MGFGPCHPHLAPKRCQPLQTDSRPFSATRHTHPTHCSMSLPAPQSHHQSSRTPTLSSGQSDRKDQTQVGHWSHSVACEIFLLATKSQINTFFQECSNILFNNLPLHLSLPILLIDAPCLLPQPPIRIKARHRTT